MENEESEEFYCRWAIELADQLRRLYSATETLVADSEDPPTPDVAQALDAAEKSFNQWGKELKARIL